PTQHPGQLVHVPVLPTLDVLLDGHAQLQPAHLAEGADLDAVDLEEEEPGGGQLTAEELRVSCWHCLAPPPTRVRSAKTPLGPSGPGPGARGRAGRPAASAGGRRGRRSPARAPRPGTGARSICRRSGSPGSPPAWAAA